MAKKKSSLGLWIGIGCGALLALGALGAAGAYYAYSSAAEKLEEVAKSAAGTGDSSGITGASPTTTATGASPSTPATATPAGSGVCAKAAACCKAITEKSGANKDAMLGCNALTHAAVPESSCTQALEGYKKVAPVLGIKCD